MFPSRIKQDQPTDPGYVRKRFQQIMERADCKKVRFHDLRHAFATMPLEHGMEVKTLFAIIGHFSATTTLNTYSHITNEMQENAAASIDRGIAKTEPMPIEESTPQERTMTDFQERKRWSRTA